MMTSREVIEGKQWQGVDESVGYAIDTSNWGGSPTDVSFAVKDVSSAMVDVTAAVTSGGATILGDIITLPKIHSLIDGHLYRVEVAFSGFECYFLIQAEL